jgi:hypothetical protein
MIDRASPEARPQELLSHDVALLNVRHACDLPVAGSPDLFKLPNRRRERRFVSLNRYVMAKFTIDVGAG